MIVSALATRLGKGQRMSQSSLLPADFQAGLDAAMRLVEWSKAIRSAGTPSLTNALRFPWIDAGNSLNAHFEECRDKILKVLDALEPVGEWCTLGNHRKRSAFAVVLEVARETLCLLGATVLAAIGANLVTVAEFPTEPEERKRFLDDGEPLPIRGRITIALEPVVVQVFGYSEGFGLLEWRGVTEQLKDEARRAAGPKDNRDEPKAVFRGKGLYTIGPESIRLDGQEADVLQSLVELRAATKQQLADRSGRPDAPAVLKRICQKNPALRPFIKLPGGKAKGGYSTTISPAD